MELMHTFSLCNAHTPIVSLLRRTYTFFQKEKKEKEQQQEQRNRRLSFCRNLSWKGMQNVFVNGDSEDQRYAHFLPAFFGDSESDRRPDMATAEDKGVIPGKKRPTGDKSCWMYCLHRSTPPPPPTAMHSGHTAQTRTKQLGGHLVRRGQSLHFTLEVPSCAHQCGSAWSANNRPQAKAHSFRRCPHINTPHPQS